MDKWDILHVNNGISTTPGVPELGEDGSNAGLRTPTAQRRGGLWMVWWGWEDVEQWKEEFDEHVVWGRYWKNII